MPKQHIQISLRVEPDDYDGIKGAAEGAGMSRNAWILSKLRPHYAKSERSDTVATK